MKIASGVALVLFAATAYAKDFRSEQCGISFSYPDSWTVSNATPNPYEPARCTLAVNPPHWKRLRERSDVDPGRDAITIRVLDQSLEKAAGHYFFRFVDGECATRTPELKPGGWAVIQFKGCVPADEFITACCQVLHGTSASTGNLRSGEKASVGSEQALINDRKGHSALIFAGINLEYPKVLRELVDSLRFPR
jgi:hypothetical protein